MKIRQQKAAKKGKELHIPLMPVVIIISVLMAIAIFWLLGIDGADYQRKIEMRSIFLSTPDYFKECMRLPGGVLIWASTFLTQCMHSPWLGAIVYLILMGAIVASAWRAFRVPDFGIPALLALPAAMVLGLLNVGYAIYSLKTPGFAFLLPVGTLVAIWFFWIYRKLRPWWVRLIIAGAIPVCCFGAFGFYALLAAAMCAAYAATEAAISGRSWWKGASATVAAAISIIIVPKYWVDHVSSDLSAAFVYRCPLPRFIEGEEHLWLPYMIVVVALVLLAGWSAWAKRQTYGNTNGRTAASAIVGLLSIAALFVCRYTDSNFKLSLTLDRMLWEQDWAAAADQMSRFNDEPTRLNVILSDMALIRAGRAPESIFAYPIGGAPYTTSRSMRVPHDAASMIFSYHMGLINYAYRWAMEYKVEYGMNVEQLKIMAKCALLNGDYDIALKCLDNLEATAFHKDWAKKYRQMAEDPSLIIQDPEMAAIRQLIYEKNEFIQDNGQLEGYVWHTLANVETGGEELLELSLVSALVCREIDAFAERLPFYARLHERLPLHFQEGILIWSKVHNNDAFRHYHIDQTVKDNFKRFIETQRQLDNLNLEEQREMMRPAFGHTYWFYALYLRDQQVI